MRIEYVAQFWGNCFGERSMKTVKGIMLIYRAEGVRTKSRCGKSTGGIHWQHPPQPDSQLAVAWEKVTEINVLVAS